MLLQKELPISSFLVGFLLVISIHSLSCSNPQNKVAGGRESNQPDGKPGPGADIPDDTRPVIVALGDSLTAGLGVEPASSYPARLQKRLDDQGYLYRVVNAGVSGDTSFQGLNRLEAVRAQNPEIVVVALGGNDGLRGLPVETTYRNLEAIITRLRDDGVQVVLAGMLMPPNYGLGYTRAFREIYSDLAGSHEIPLVPFLLDGVAGIVSLNQADGIHPTAEGYEIVVENVWKVVEPLLKKR